MQYDLTPLFLFVFLGGPLMVQYWYMYATYGRRTDNLYWGYMPQKVRDFSKLTIPLAFLAGLYMLYYSIAEIPKSSVVHNEYEPNGKYILYLSLCLFMFGANLWPFSLIHNTPKYVSILSLVITAVGTALLMDCVLNEHMENLDTLRIVAIVATSILVFQTGIMDLLIWSYYFLKFA
jgi:hypothetical protein